MPQVVLLSRVPRDGTPCTEAQVAERSWSLVLGKPWTRSPEIVPPSFAGYWRLVLFSSSIWDCYTHLARRNRRTARPIPQIETPQSTQKSEPLREKGVLLTCRPYKQSGCSSRSSPPGPAFSLQREYISVVAQAGPRGGSWSRLPWLSYTSTGRKLKLRFLTSSPRRASWCLESRLGHHHGFPPPRIRVIFPT